MYISANKRFRYVVLAFLQGYINFTTLISSYLYKAREYIKCRISGASYAMNMGPYDVVDLNAWPIALNPSERHRISSRGASQVSFALPSGTRNFIISLSKREYLPFKLLERFNIGLRST